MTLSNVKIRMTTIPGVFAWVLLILHWGFVLVHYPDLPALIPIHFDAAGEPDSYGNRIIFWLLPAINTALFALLLVLSRYPHRLNYPVSLTPSNTEALYRYGVSTLQFLQLSVTALFSLITWQTARIAMGYSDGLGVWMLPLVLSLVFLPLLVFVYRCYTLR